MAIEAMYLPQSLPQTITLTNVVFDRELLHTLAVFGD